MADLAIVIPTWNESKNLELLLPAIRETVAELRVDAEIIVADAGSTDGSEQVARSFGAVVVRQSERGYGGALLAGFAAATAPWIITMDADLSHPPDVIRSLWRCRGEVELLIASRFVAGGKADTGAFRLLLSRVLNVTFRAVRSLPFHDLSSGFRCYRRESLVSIHAAARDFDFLQEVLIRLYRSGARIVEVPFHYSPRRTGRSHVRLARFGWAYSKTLLRMWRLRWEPPRRRAGETAERSMAATR